MALPFASPTNITSFTGVFEYAGTITGDWFGVLLVFGVWVVSFLAFANRPPSQTLAGASFISELVAVLLWTMGICGATPVIISTLALVLSSIYLFYAPR